MAEVDADVAAADATGVALAFEAFLSFFAIASVFIAVGCVDWVEEKELLLKSHAGGPLEFVGGG